MRPLAVVGAVFASVVLLAAVVLGGWQAGWWFRNQNVNRESHVLRNSYANQQTLRDQITARIADVQSVSAQIAGTRDQGELAALKSQRVAIVNIVCGDAEQVTGDPLSPEQAQFIAANCAYGSISPSSPNQ